MPIPSSRGCRTGRPRKFLGSPGAFSREKGWASKKIGLSPTPLSRTAIAPEFKVARAGFEPAIVDVYSNLIENDDGRPCFRLVALVDVTAHQQLDGEAIEDRIREKDTLLRE